MADIELAAGLPRPIAYVLAGGASYGAVQVGHLRALARTDVVPDFVVGTSVGSLNGAVLAEDPAAAPRRLATLWASITRQEVFGTMLGSAISIAAGKPSATTNAGLRDVVERALDARTFDQLQLPHTAMATDFDTGRSVALREGDLVSALLASTAIPLVFPVVERGDRRLVDGGLVANVPIRAAAAQGASTIVVLDCGFTLMPPEREDTYTSRLLRAAAIMAAQQVRRDLEGVTDRYVLYLPGPWPIRARPDDFTVSTELAQRTYGLTMSWLLALRLRGPGRYGAAPTDALAKVEPLPRPEHERRRERRGRKHAEAAAGDESAAADEVASAGGGAAPEQEEDRGILPVDPLQVVAATVEHGQDIAEQGMRVLTRRVGGDDETEGADPGREQAPLAAAGQAAPPPGVEQPADPDDSDGATGVDSAADRDDQAEVDDSAE